MLDVLGLPQYKKKFKEEKISGALLQELDEDILKTELEVSLKIHRLRLLRVIDGRQSLYELFTSCSREHSGVKN